MKVKKVLIRAACVVLLFSSSALTQTASSADLYIGSDGTKWCTYSYGGPKIVQAEPFKAPPRERLTPPSEQPPERIVEQPPERIVEQPPERIVEQPPERIVEQPPERIVEQPPERIVEQPPERIVEQPPERIVEQPPERIVEQPPERIVEQPPERIVEQPPERIVEQPPERIVEQPPERIVEQPPERIVEQPPERIVEQPPERIVEQPPERTVERPPERTVERPPERTVERTVERPPEGLKTTPPAETPPPVEPTPPPPTRRDPRRCLTNIYFGNGVNVSLTAALATVEYLISEYKAILDAAYPGTYRFLPAYNPTASLMTDVTEVLIQKMRAAGFKGSIQPFSPRALSALLQQFSPQAVRNITGLVVPRSNTSYFTPQFIDELVKTISKTSLTARVVEAAISGMHANMYAGAVQAGRRVFVISHSQGNLFANAALAAAAKRVSSPQSLQQIGVATPAKKQFRPFYLTAHDDRIIGPLSRSGLALPTNINNYLPGYSFRFSSIAKLVPNLAFIDIAEGVALGQDLTGHSFIESYMYERLLSRRKIDTELYRLASSTPFPLSAPWCRAGPDYGSTVERSSGKKSYERTVERSSGKKSYERTVERPPRKKSYERTVERPPGKTPEKTPDKTVVKKPTVIVKAKQTVLRGAGKQGGGQAVAGQQIKLFADATVAQALPGTSGAQKNDAGFDQDPMQCTTGQDGACVIALAEGVLDQAASDYEVNIDVTEQASMNVQLAAASPAGQSAGAALAALPENLQKYITDSQAVNGNTYVTLTYPSAQEQTIQNQLAQAIEKSVAATLPASLRRYITDTRVVNDTAYVMLSYPAGREQTIRNRLKQAAVEFLAFAPPADFQRPVSHTPAAYRQQDFYSALLPLGPDHPPRPAGRQGQMLLARSMVSGPVGSETNFCRDKQPRSAPVLFSDDRRGIPTQTITLAELEK